MHFARLFDGVDESGQPFFKPNRETITDPVERQRILSFLNSGALVLRAAGRIADVIEPSRGQAVPIATYTDGTWIWSAGIAYYLEYYGIKPEAAFLAHMVMCDYQAPQPGDATV